MKSDRGLDVERIRQVLRDLRRDMFSKHHRHVSVGDLLNDRWETAKSYGFGPGTSCYDNVLVIGDVKVGANTWIGPNTILDGSGGLEIGDNVSISAGAQIYSHHTVAWSTSLGQGKVVRKPTRVGNGVYIGPNAIVEMGHTLFDRSIIGALTLVQCDVPASHRCFGVPGQVLPPLTE